VTNLQRGVPLIQCTLRSVKTVWKDKRDYGGKDLWNIWVISLEWKVEAVIDGESEGGACDEVMCKGWGEPGEWTKWGWREL